MTARQTAADIRRAFGRRNSILQKPKPLHGLKKGELQEEVEQRGLLEDTTNMVKADLERELISELQDVQRVPALLYCDPIPSFESLNLGSYEALGCEPMHDISNHIANVVEELSKHLQGEAKTKFDETWELTLGEKETKRACDHRFAKIMFVKTLKGLVTETLQTLLLTLVEMEQVLYAKDYKRYPRLILRYHSISFLHFVMCSLEFGSSPTAECQKMLWKVPS